MKRVTFITILFFICTQIYGQNSVTGIVSDENKVPIPGAHVVLENAYFGTITNPNGSFLLSNISNGKYKLKVSFLGYNTYINEINVNSDLDINIQLSPSDILTDEVIVSAIRADMKTPVAYTKIDNEEIQKRNTGKDIPFILSMVPSVVSSSDAGAGVGYSGFRIRGSDATRINVTVNGIPLNDPESHGVFWVNMPDFSSSLEDIQVQRGVGSSTNGAAAFGASVNLRTLALNKEAYSQISTSYGSFNTWKTNLAAGTGLINNKFAFDARVSKIHSDGFIDRAWSDLESFYLSGSYYDKKNLLKFNIISGQEETYQAWNGVPKVRLENDYEGMMRYQDHYLYSEEETQQMLNSDSRTYNRYTYENEIDHYEQAHYQLHYSRELTQNLQFSTALHYTHGEGYYEQFKANDDFEDYGLENAIIGSDTIESTDLIRRKWLNNNFYGFTYSLEFNPNKKFSATLGGAWNKYDGGHYGRIIWAQFASNGNPARKWYENDGTKSDFNVFYKMNYTLFEKFNLWSDIQYRHIDYEIMGVHDDFKDLTMSTNFDFINPKIGLSVNLTNNKVIYTSFAVANREPSRGAFRDAKTDVEPKPEILHDYEAGFRMNTQSFSFNANVYYMNYTDQLVMTGEINDVGAAILANVPDSYRAGIELIAGISPTKWFRWTANTTLSQNRIENFTEYVDDWDDYVQNVSYLGTTDLSFSPNITAASEIVVMPINNFEISALTKYVGSQYIDNTMNDSRMLDAYTTTDLNLSYKFETKLFKEVAINLSLNNIFNAEYETNAWVYRYYYGVEHNQIDGYFPQAGFHFLAGLNIKI